MDYQCSRVITKNGKIEYCHKSAIFVSPPGIHTGRVINICLEHRNDLQNVFEIHEKIVHFQRL